MIGPSVMWLLPLFADPILVDDPVVVQDARIFVFLLLRLIVGGGGIKRDSF